MTQEVRMTFARRAIPIMALVAIAFLASIGVASAAPFEDITDAFSERIGVSSYVGTMILSFVGVGSLAIVLAVLGMDLLPTLLVLLVGIGAFTAIGWLDAWVLIMSAVVVGVYFAGSIKSGVLG